MNELEIKQSAIDLIREFDEQFQRQWNHELKRCEKNGDIEKLLRMNECDLSILETDFTDLIRVMFDGEAKFNEYNDKLQETMLIVADVLDSHWIMDKKDRLFQMKVELGRSLDYDIHRIYNEVRKRYSIVSKLIMS